MTPPLKVLQIVHGHPAERPGGAEVYAWELYQAMRAHPGFDAAIITRTMKVRSDSLPLWPDPGDANHHWLSTPTDDFDFFYQECRSIGATAPWIDRLLRRLNPDIVHVQHTYNIGMDLFRRIRAALPDAKIIYTLHEFMPICYHRGLLYKTVHRSPCAGASPAACNQCFPDIGVESFAARAQHLQRRLGFVDRFLAPSRFLRERFVEWGLPAAKIEVEEYGRLSASQPVDEPHAGPRNRFGFFGQINPFKGVDVLLAAALQLAREGVPIEVQIHGANLELQPPRFQEAFRQLLAQSIAAKVARHRGSYSQADLPARLAGVDWVVVPSVWYENSPLVIQEAFQAGRPVIASNLGSMAEKVRDGVDGLLFEANHSGSLAACLSRASSLELWSRLRANVRPPYAMAAHLERLAALYR